MCGEYPELRIALLKSGVVFFECFFRLSADLGIRAGVLPVADLDDNFVKRLLLLSVDDMLVVIRDNAVAPFLLFVIPCKRIVKQLVIDCLDLFVAEIRVQMCTFRVGILCGEFPAVVVCRAFPTSTLIVLFNNLPSFLRR